MSAGKIIKCIFGLIVVMVLSASLPFFDKLPWNIPAYKKRAVVRDCVQQLATHPAVIVSQYRDMMRDGGSREEGALILKLQDVYPSAIAMLYRAIKGKDARVRAWGLLAVVECSPRNATQGQYAPLLKPTIEWLKDPDPVVSANALSVLERYTELPRDYFESGGPLYQKKMNSPAEWHAVYNQWYRDENPEWHLIECRYYCKRNWPAPIQ